MVDIANQLCIKSYDLKAENGDHFKVEQGETYTTTVPCAEQETVVVFTDFWVPVPKDHFVLVEE